jgi:hypothetical protein
MTDKTNFRFRNAILSSPCRISSSDLQFGSSVRSPCLGTYWHRFTFASRLMLGVLTSQRRLRPFLANPRVWIIITAAIFVVYQYDNRDTSIEVQQP